MAGTGGVAGGVAVAALAAAALCLSSGCANVGYLAQSVGGHWQLMNAAQPVADWLAAPGAAAALKQQLQLSQRLRDYAVRELHLPDNASYRRYADLHRRAAVWNVAAAPELSLTLQTWCFPVAGCVGYRGYYDEAAAQAEADRLRQSGLEATVYPVAAYSTLGKLDWLGGDPLLNTFIQWPEGELARLMFHELAHQVVYVPGDTTFNESYATAVERLGVARWLAAQDSQAVRATSARFDARREDFRALTGRWREQLDALYRGGEPDDAKRQRKAALMAQMQAEYVTLKTTSRWQGWSGYDAFFARANNAALGMLAAYDQQVPAFEALFEREGRDFARFHAAVRQLAALPGEERAAALRAALL